MDTLVSSSAADADLPAMLAHADACIERYAARCRARIPDFVDRHFSLEQTWRLQRPTLWIDLLSAPVNSVWAVPYMAAKKACGMLDALGVPFAAQAVARLPPGIKTGYQRTIESLIARDVLEWDPAGGRAGIPEGLLGELRTHRSLESFTMASPAAARGALRTILENFSAGRAVVSSLAGTGLTIALGWLLVGRTSATVAQIAAGVAGRNARRRAAARFFLGRRVGAAFYGFFPPSASPLEIDLIFVLLCGLIAVGTLACAIGSDPLRKLAGLHQRRLVMLVDSVERELTLLSKKAIKRRSIGDD